MREAGARVVGGEGKEGGAIGGKRGDAVEEGNGRGGDGQGPTHIYVSDRFEPYVTQNLTERYVWLPLTWDAKGAAVVDWHDEWQL
jgi:hypothetical protein